MSVLINSLIATFLISLISLVALVFWKTKWSDSLETASLSFGAGVLLATTFLELLPEALARGGNDVLSASMAGMIGFFALERVLHENHSDAAIHAGPSRYLILIGDGVHNFIDGVVIAASFVISPTLGLTTTLAVAAHEIPQEFADYGILVSGGFTRRVALQLNFLSGLTAILGAIVCLMFQETIEKNLGWFMAATAGMFLYIAASDLMPELQHPQRRGSWLSGAPLLVGVALIALLEFFVH